MTSGWAFLVARGRRQGHRARLVPDVLAELGLSGVVEENGSADTPAGRVTVVSRTHRVRPEDIGTEHVLDEHGRPLDIIYGFVCLDVLLDDVDETDLATAFAQALAAYRRFLADESGFATEVSPPFPLQSVVAPPLLAAARLRPSRAAVALGAVGLLAAALVVLLVLVPTTSRPRTDDLTGTWHGTTFTVTITCRPGCPVEPGTVIGTVRAPACDYVLALGQLVNGTLQATASRPKGAGCLPDGQISLRRTAVDRIRLEWRDASTGEFVQEAELRPSTT